MTSAYGTILDCKRLNFTNIAFPFRYLNVKAAAMMIHPNES